jgi:predicted kinase
MSSTCGTPSAGKPVLTSDLPGTFVVVSGPAGSGKTTLALALAPALGLPLLAKDTIKQALMTVLPVPDVSASQLLGRAVLESVWHRSYARLELRKLPAPIIEVLCRCDQATAEQRYRQRSGTRAAGHFDGQRSPAELWTGEATEPVAGGWPVIQIDTTIPLEVSAIAARVRAAAIGSG